MTLPKGLYKRGNCYYLDYKDETGRRIRRSAGRDLHHALDLLHKLRRSEPDKSQISLKSLLDSYLTRLRVYSKRKSVGNGESAARQIVSHFGDPPIASMSQSDLDRFVSQRRAQGVVDKTINGDLIILRAALNHGVAIGLLQKLPFKVKLLKVPKRRIAPILSPQDIQRLLSLASGRIFGILLVAVYTGFRNSEIVHLKWRDVGWADASLNVTTKDGIWSSKNHQERKVFVPEEVLNWLRAYRDRAQFAGESDWIFSTKRGTPLTTFNTCHAIRHVFEAAGLYRRGVPTLHLIRHTVACNLLQGGVDIETVRDWLGHADISTTALYLHSTDARKRAAASALRGLHCVVSATVNQVGVSDVFGEPKSPLEGGES